MIFCARCDLLPPDRRDVLDVRITVSVVMLGDDLTPLRAQHPGWHIGTVWISAATGPDAQRLDATRDGIRVYAWSAAELSACISEAERQMGDGESV